MKSSKKNGDNIMQQSSISSVRQKSSPMIPVCCICQRTRTIQDTWESQDVLCEKGSSHSITHAFCPDCVKQHYPLVCDDVTGKKPV
jgi:hypothetical protein